MPCYFRKVDDMEYGFLTLIPIIVIIVMAVVTKKSFESLIVGSLVACIIMYGVHFLPEWTNMLLTAASNEDNQWVILVCGLFGSLIAMLRESKGTNGFVKLGEKLCRSERTTLLGTFILGVIIFVDDYLNMLTVGTCMRKVCDRRKIPREALAYLLDSTGTPICILLPFSTWAVFYISLFMKEDSVQALGFASGMDLYSHIIPYIFYAIFTVIIVLLFSFGLMPKLGKMSKAYKRTRETGMTYSEASRKYNHDIDKGYDDGNILDFLIPIAVLIALTIITTDMLLSVIVTLVVCLVMYVPRKIMTFAQWSSLLITGFCEMLPTLAILIGAFTVANCCETMGLSQYIIHAVQPYLNSQSFAAIIFIVVALLTFATSSTWGVSTIVVPIILPLAAAVDANLILTMAAILSGSTFGSHACFYSDATVLASTASQIENLEHAVTQIPYALIAAVLALAGYMVFGFVL
ncbi:MAG: Na+/H+ antiporter NhaC family protein [Candidatus Ornithomonoglobus sp.]